MNLFRSEEHVRNWAGYAPDTEEGIIRLPELVTLFSGPYFRNRMDADWHSHRREYAIEMVKTLAAIGKTGPFWSRPESKGAFSKG